RRAGPAKIRSSYGLSPDHPAAVEHALRIKAPPHALPKCRKACRLRMEYVDISPHLLARAQQRGMAAGRVDAAAHQRRLRVRLGWQRGPDQSAAPIIDHVAPGFARQSLP